MGNFKFKDNYATSYRDTIGWQVADEVWILNTYRRSRTTCRHITQLRRILEGKGVRYIELETDLSFNGETFPLELLDYVNPCCASNYKSLLELAELGIVDYKTCWSKFIKAYLRCLKMGTEQERRRVWRTITRLDLDPFQLAKLELIRILVKKHKKEEEQCAI